MLWHATFQSTKGLLVSEIIQLSGNEGNNYCELNWLWIFRCIICLLDNKRWVVNAHGFVSWQYKQKEVRPQFPDVLDCLSQSNYDLKCVCINSKIISGKTKYGLTGQNSNKTMQKKLNKYANMLSSATFTKYCFVDITTMYTTALQIIHMCFWERFICGLKLFSTHWS